MRLKEALDIAGGILGSSDSYTPEQCYEIDNFAHELLLFIAQDASQAKELAQVYARLTKNVFVDS